MLLNCSAGKERTGIGAALVLSALGVPRRTVLYDFMLSERYFPAESEIPRVREKYGVTDEGYRWSAQVVSSVDGLPFIGRNGGSQNVYIATGFGGNGLTFGTIAALLVSDLVLGIDNPWTALYHTTRVKLSALGDIVKAQAHVPAHLLGHTDVKLPSEIAIGQGAVLKQDGKHLAVYRDAEGTLHGVTARCTHAGCMVAFNDAERSWDCPCHGSRFATDGSILEGPAVVQLESHHVRDE